MPLASPKQARPRSRLILAGLLLTLAACGNPTPYQAAPEGQSGQIVDGYSDNGIADDRYRVTFSGNFLTARETVEDYLLLRAAQVALRRGYDYFLVVEQETERETVAYHPFYDEDYPFSGFGYSSDHPLYDQYFGRFGPSYVIGPPRERHRYTAHAEIQMRHGKKPADAPNAYDARAVLDRLAPTIHDPAPR